MIPHTPIDLYVQAVDMAKEKEGLSNQDKLLLNRFKMLLRSGAVEDADSEIARMGKVRKKTLHNLRELAESIFEDWVRKLDTDDAEREKILREGKQRAKYAEEHMINDLQLQGLVTEN